MRFVLAAGGKWIGTPTVIDLTHLAGEENYSTIEMTMRYTHVSSESLKSAIGALLNVSRTIESRQSSVNRVNR